MTPSELTMAMMARKEMLTGASCRAIGKPSFSVFEDHLPVKPEVFSGKREREALFFGPPGHTGLR